MISIYDYEFLLIKCSIASRYESRPIPEIIPMQLGARNDVCLYVSREKMLVICTSTTGISIALIASPKATDV